jgi:hypothetical protein
MNLEEKIRAYQHFITANGRAEIQKLIARWKEEHGKNWIREFKKDFPIMRDVIDLAANFDAPEAFIKLKDLLAFEIQTHFEPERKAANTFLSQLAVGTKEAAAKTAALSFLDSNQTDVFKLHAELRAEIDKPRF